MMRYLKEIIERYENWATPTFNDWQQPVFVGQHPWLIQLDCSRGSYRYIHAWDLRTFQKSTKISWWAPWKKHAFVWLLEPKSSWIVMLAAPAMVRLSDHSPLSGQEIAEMVIEELNSVQEEPDF